MKRWKLWGAAGAALLAAAFTAPDAMAMDAAAAVPADSRSLWDILAAGGLIGALIILCSIAGLAVAIECLMRLRAEKLAPPALAAELEALLDEGRLDEAAEACERNPCYLANAVGAAVARADDGYAAAAEELEGALQRENVRCLQRISYLSLLGNLGPMLGLTGTVTGMIGAFMVIEGSAEPPSAALLAKGVYEALVTTAEGLFLAIPILTVYFVLKNRVQSLAMDIGDLAESLVRRVKVQIQ